MYRLLAIVSRVSVFLFYCSGSLLFYGVFLWFIGIENNEVLSLIITIVMTLILRNYVAISVPSYLEERGLH